MIQLLLLGFAMVAAGMGGYYVGRSNRMPSADRKAYVEHRHFVMKLNRLAAQHAVSEPFANIVLDEMNTFMEHQNRSIK